MRLAASGYRQRWKYGQPEARAVEPFDPGRQHIAVKRSARTARAGAVIAGRPKNGTGIPSFIFWSASRSDACHRAAPRSRAARRLCLLDQLPPIAAKPRDHAVQQRIVVGAIDLGERDPVLDAGKHCDLPICNMAGEDNHPPAGRNRPIHMFEAMRLDPPARFEDADFP
jgi:hypothetical protein